MAPWDAFAPLVAEELGGRVKLFRQLEHSRATWAACAPINAWLDEHVGASERPAESRYGRRR